MDLSPFGVELRRSAVIIMGAGATRGASFVKASSVIKPPLDADFFSALRLAAPTDEAQLLLEFIRREFGSFEVGMEAFYSQAFLHDKFSEDIPVSKRTSITRYAKNLTRFRALLPQVIGASVAQQECTYHDELVASAAANDVFISFNYDCVLDSSLARAAGQRWNPSVGYGFRIRKGLAAWKSYRGENEPRPRTLRLLKLHGSLNWRRGTGEEIVLLGDPYAERDPEELLIIPPLWQKNFDENPYRHVWRRARQYLSSAKSLFVIGYSLPDTDVYTQAMLRIDVTELAFLCIVNPDKGARSRIKTALRSAIDASTYLVELNSLEELFSVFARSPAVPPAA